MQRCHPYEMIQRPNAFINCIMNRGYSKSGQSLPVKEVGDLYIVLNLCPRPLEVFVLDYSPLRMADSSPVSFELVDDVFVALAALDHALSQELAFHL